MVYNNLVCDGCGKVMHEDDDIVVCPICGTPQHRECYNKNNCCVNEAKHSEGFVWQAPKKPHEIELENLRASEPDNVVPPEEKRPPVLFINPETDSNFEKIFMRGVSENSEESIDTAKVGEAAVYVQSAAGKYIHNFKRNENKKRYISWNWAAFFFSPYWFFYRKLYRLGFIFLGLSVAISIAMVYPMDKIMPDIDKLSEITQEYRDSSTKGSVEDQNTLYQNYIAKAKPIAVKCAPTLLFALLVNFILPNTVAAIIANSQYKKKMLMDINISHKGSTDHKLVTLSIIRKGGVSLFAAMGSILVGQLLPSAIISIIDKIIL